MTGVLCAADYYSEDKYRKDYVRVQGKSVTIAVNRNTEKVELYWSEKDNDWIKPDAEYQKVLQDKHQINIRMMEAQGAMDEMHDETWYNSDIGAGRAGP
jgi:hypothetical protein